MLDRLTRPHRTDDPVDLGALERGADRYEAPQRDGTSPVLRRH